MTTLTFAAGAGARAHGEDESRLESVRKGAAAQAGQLTVAALDGAADSLFLLGGEIEFRRGGRGGGLLRRSGRSEDRSYRIGGCGDRNGESGDGGELAELTAREFSHDGYSSEEMPRL